MSLLLLFNGAAAANVDYTLTCDVGSYAYTGQSATLQVRHSLTCDAGDYTYTGQAATLKVVHSLTCAVGAYNYTGNDATLAYVPGTGAVNYTLSCDAGSYVYTGQDSTLTYVEGAVEVPRTSGGGRYIGYLPPYEKKKPVVRLKWTDEKEKELATLLRKIDEDYEKKRAQQFQELLEILRTAIYLGNEVSLSGFDYLKEQDLVSAKRKIQQEEEEILLLVA